MIGCTIVARNYLPYARVVAAGWREAHPQSPFCVLVLDGDRGSQASEPFRITLPEDLGMSPRGLARMRGMYGVAEINSALKPHLLRALLDQGADAVIYLDSDTDVHGALDDVADLVRRSGVALTPNVLEPLALDGMSPSELELERVGLYNSGSIAVGQSDRAFLEWWSSRTRRDCLFAEDEGLHADQRWLDWVPVYFPHGVQRDPTLNVAHWNLHERRIGREGTTFLVGDRPLRTFHFAGYDPERPAQVTKYRWGGPLRGLREPNAALADLCVAYGAKLMAAGYSEARSTPYRWGHTAAGTPLGWRERTIYRELVLAAEEQGHDIADPFDVRRSREFERMLHDPRSSGLLSPSALERIGGRRPWSHALVRHGLRQIPGPQAGDRTRAEYTPDGIVREPQSDVIRPTTSPHISPAPAEPAPRL